MSGKRGPVIIAASGPAAAGKSMLVRWMAPKLRERGFAVTTMNGDGCVVCRGFRRLPRWPDLTRAGSPARMARTRRALSIARSWGRHVHALVDAADLALRLLMVTLWGPVRARGRPAAVLTDRGPLDALAEYGPSPRSPLARLLTWLARCYDLTLLLDGGADAPMTRTWAARCPPEDPWEPYRPWVLRIPSVAPLDARTAPSAVADEALRHLVARLGARDGGKHVVISAFDGAAVVERVARRLSEEFRVTVVIAARHGGTRDDGGMTHRSVPVTWAGPRAGRFLFRALLPFVACRTHHDLWVECLTPHFRTSLLPLLSRRPVIGIRHPSDGGRGSYHGLRRYRHLVVTDETDLPDIRRRSPGTSVHVIENGVDHRQVDVNRLGDGDYGLFVGPIETWEEGLDLLLTASAGNGLPMPLLLAGDGAEPEERKLRDLLSGQDGCVRWLGHVQGRLKQELLRNSAFIVLPSRREAAATAVLEGMAYGKPVLHFDLPSLRWTRTGGGVGVPPFDVDLLAERMRRLAVDTRWRRRLGRQAYEAAQQRTWGETTAKYLALVRDLLASPASSGGQD